MNRRPSRSGTFAVPLPGQGAYRLCPWEYTLAELLSDAGYATSQWGKWHLGEVEGRLPNDQGFDECWFEKNTTYIALTHFHRPEAVHPDFDQKSPALAGLYADIIAEQDYRTGQIWTRSRRPGSPTTGSWSCAATTQRRQEA